jgi:3-methylcrotonyl-CoA carboxylase alpha subunit
VFADAFPRQFQLDQPRGTGVGTIGDGSILSPLPGKIIAVEVSAGQQVTKGQKLLTLEAMKVEHTLVAPFDGVVAPFDGVVAELIAAPGAQVQVEAVLARL